MYKGKVVLVLICLSVWACHLRMYSTDSY